MERQFFDNVKLEKERAVLRFNRFCRVAKVWQILEVLVVFGLVTWSSARVPAILKVAGDYFVEFSAYLFNHHVVFLIGNAIVVLLFVLCRQNDAVSASGGGGDFYDDYVKHSEAAASLREPALHSPEIGSSTAAEGGGDEEKQIVVLAAARLRESDLHAPEIGSSTAAEGGGDEEKKIVVRPAETEAVAQCGDVAAAIEKAARQIKRFERTQSEKLKRELGVKPRRELRRSETENRRSSGECTASLEAAEIETLSNEEFRRTVDAFIDRHWGKKKL